MRPLIAFDFDGTIADSIDLFVDILNGLERLERRNHSITREDLRATPAPRLLRKLGIPLWHVPRHVKEARAAFAKRLDEISIHPGMPSLLGALKERAALAIVTTNLSENVEAVLQREGLGQHFISVTEAGVFGKHAHLKRLKKEYPRMLYVGDENRDIHAAKRAGIDSCGVTWGYAGAKTLLRSRPTMIASDAEELGMLLEAWLDELL